MREPCSAGYLRIILKKVNEVLGNRRCSPGRCAGKLCKICRDGDRLRNLGSLPHVFNRAGGRNCAPRVRIRKGYAKDLRIYTRPAIYVPGGWRRRVSRQSGQVRKEAALTNRMRVAVQPLTAALRRHCERSEAIQGWAASGSPRRRRLAMTIGRKRLGAGFIPSNGWLLAHEQIQR